MRKTEKKTKKTNKHPNWGGFRPGAGTRPQGKAALNHVKSLRLDDEQAAQFDSLGGSKWLRNYLDRSASSVIKDGYTANEMMPVGIVHSVSVPMGWSTVQAGFPSPAEQYQGESIDFNDLLVDNESATFVLRAKGESMIEAGIDEGDLLVVDRSKDEKVGDIVIMQVNNDFTVKRLLKTSAGQVYLHPENSSGLYNDIYPEETDEWLCFGVVRHVIKSLK